MANEYTISMSANVRNGTLVDGFNPDVYQADQATQLVEAGVQIIGTTYEQITVGDITSAGPAGFKNLDSTNYVQIGVEVAAAFHPLHRLPAGKSELVWLEPGISYYAKANTAAVKLKKWIGSR